MPSDRDPDLSVVLRVVGGGAALSRCLRHLMPQTHRPDRPVEVIVPVDSTVSGMEAVRAAFPEATFIDMGTIVPPGRERDAGVAHVLYDRRTACGLAAARAPVVALLEDYGAPASDWCENILALHRSLPHPVIGGAVEHAGSGIWNWALYFLDFGRYQPPLQEGPADYVSDVNCSYKREALFAVRPLWEQKYNEVTVHWEMMRRGGTLWRTPRLLVLQDRGPLRLSRLAAERFWWGRLFAAARLPEMSGLARLGYVILSPLIPVVMLARIAKRALRPDAANKGWFLASLPCTLLLTALWCCGEAAGYITGKASADRH